MKVSWVHAPRRSRIDSSGMREAVEVAGCRSNPRARFPRRPACHYTSLACILGGLERRARLQLKKGVLERQGSPFGRVVCIRPGLRLRSVVHASALGLLYFMASQKAAERQGGADIDEGAETVILEDGAELL